MNTWNDSCITLVSMPTASFTLRWYECLTNHGHAERKGRNSLLLKTWTSQLRHVYFDHYKMQTILPMKHAIHLEGQGVLRPLQNANDIANEACHTTGGTRGSAGLRRSRACKARWWLWQPPAFQYFSCHISVQVVLRKFFHSAYAGTGAPGYAGSISWAFAARHGSLEGLWT